MADSASADIFRLFRSRLIAEECARAESLFDECKAILQKEASNSAVLSQDDKNDDAWRACVLWLIQTLPGVLKRSTAAEPQPAPKNGVPLSDLLNNVGSNLIAFFKEVPVVLAKLKPFLSTLIETEDSLESALRLREWQETLVSLTILAKKYKDLFWRFHRLVTAPKQPAMQAGWLTFLLLKAELLPEFPDLVSCLQLMVCVLDLFVASMPLSDSELKQMQADNPAAIDSAGKFKPLKALAANAKADFGRCQGLMPEVEKRFRALLSAAKFSWVPDPLPETCEHPNSAAVDTSCGLYVEGMLTNKTQLQELVMFLDQHYQEIYEQQGEIDEREFLTTDFGALASPRTMPGSQPAGLFAKPSLAQGASYVAPGSQGVGRKLAIGLQSPLPIMHLGPAPPATPVTQTMGSVSWLRNLAKDLSLGPPPAVLRYLAAAGPSVASAVTQRVKEAATGVFSVGAGPMTGLPSLHSFPELQESVARERRHEGIKLYWHVLDAMLRAEEANAGAAGVNSLITRWSFHQCLLACSFEMVAASYRMGSLSFPSIPERLKLKPFDLVKMIGPFVHAEPSLPRDLKHHLFTIEEKILESVAWQPGSSIYPTLIAATTAPVETMQVDSTEAASAHSNQDKPVDSVGTADGSAVVGTGNAVQQTYGQSVAPEDEAMQDRDADESLGRSQQENQIRVEQENPGLGGHAVSSGPQTYENDIEMNGESMHGQDKETAAEERMVNALAGHTATTGGKLPASALQAVAGGHMGQPASPKRDGDHMEHNSPNKRQRGSSGAVGGRGAAAHQPRLSREVPLPRALGHPPGSNGMRHQPGDRSAQAILHDFAKKVMKLAAFRLVAISDGFDFGPGVEHNAVLTAVHEVIGYALYQQTHLFYGRHLDQILLSALYGYCKVNRLQQMSFREIISHYRKQPHAKMEVFRTVVLSQTDPGLITQSTGDIIAFYNQVFVPSMKSYLLAANPGNAAAPGVSPSSTGMPGSAGLPAAACGSIPAAAAASLRQQQQPGHINRSPILTALEMREQQGGGRGTGVQHTIGPRAPLQPLQTGGSAYRTLSLDAGAAGLAGGIAGGDNSGRGTPGGLLLGGLGSADYLGHDLQPPQLVLSGVASNLRGVGGKPALQGPYARHYVPSRLGKPPAGPSAHSHQQSAHTSALQQDHQADVAAHAQHGTDQQVNVDTTAGQQRQHSVGSDTENLGSLNQAATNGSSPGDSPDPNASSVRGFKRLPPLQLAGTTTGLATLLQALDTTGASDQMESGPHGHNVGGFVSHEQPVVMQDS